MNVNTGICKKEAERDVSSWGRRRPGGQLAAVQVGARLFPRGPFALCHAHLRGHRGPRLAGGSPRPSHGPQRCEERGRPPAPARFSAHWPLWGAGDALRGLPTRTPGAVPSGALSLLRPPLRCAARHSPFEVWPPRAHGLCVNDTLLQVLRATRI